VFDGKMGKLRIGQSLRDSLSVEKSGKVISELCGACFTIEEATCRRSE